MLSLPDVDSMGGGGARPGRRIHVFDEQTRNHGDGASSDSQAQSSDEQVESQDTTPSLTTSMSMTSSDEQLPTPKEASPVPTTRHCLGGLKSKYALTRKARTGKCCRKVEVVSLQLVIKPSRQFDMWDVLAAIW